MNTSKNKKIPPLAKQTLYTVNKRVKDPFYECVKFDLDMNVLAVYQMVEGSGGAITCTCPAHKPWHKHCEVLRLFQAEERINSGWRYNYDTAIWIPPITDED